MARSIRYLSLASILAALSPLTAAEWIHVPPNQKSVTGFEVDPHHIGGLYAIAGDELLWSPNRGTDWVSLLDVDVFVGGHGIIQTFAVDRHDPQALYVGIRTTEAAFLRSNDRGNTWTATGFSGDWLYDLESDVHHPGTLSANIE